MVLTGTPTPGGNGSFREMKKNQWKLPITGSILFHILVLGGSVFSSYLLPDQDIQEIHTVDLVNIEEALPEEKQEPSKKPEKKAVKPPAPEKKAETEPRPEPEKISTEVVKESREPAMQESTPEEVISLKPRLTKKEITSPEKSREREKQIDQALDRIKRDLQRKKAEEMALQAEEEARLYAREAVQDLSSLLQTQEPDEKTETAPPSEKTKTKVFQGGEGKPGEEGVGKTGSSVSKAVLKQYLASVYREIQANWILPEVTDWKKDLEAILLITITRQGTVIKSTFEKRSDNIYFDRFVEKTVDRSSPLPRFPDTLEKERLEIGLIFHPEGLQ